MIIHPPGSPVPVVEGAPYLCAICGGDAEDCAELGHEWIPCPYCGEDTRPSYEICPTCQNEG